MRLTVLLSCFGVALLGCSNDSQFPEGDGGSGGIFDGSRGGTFNASRCEASAANHPDRIACLADAGASRIALGICGDLAADNTLTLDTDSNGRNLSVSGASHTTSPLHVSGSFTSLSGITSDNTEDIAHDISTQGTLRVSSPVAVHGNAYVGQSVDATNTLTIDGALNIATASDNSNVHAGSVNVGAVQVVDPLDCSHSLDVGKLVASELEKDGALDLPADSLIKVSAPTHLTLGCDQYDFTSIESDNTLDIEVSGPTVLLVRDDFHIASPTTIHVAHGATLDLAIGGSLRIDNTLTVTSDDTDAVWIGVGSDIHVAAPLHMTGELYASLGALEADNTVDIAGAIFVGSLHVAAPIAIHSGIDIDSRGCIIAPSPN